MAGRQPQILRRLTKTVGGNRVFHVDVYDDGTLDEYEPENPSGSWRGSWRVFIDHPRQAVCVEVTIGECVTQFFEDRTAPHPFWSGDEIVAGAVAARATLRDRD